jgi:hypothetical protein
MNKPNILWQPNSEPQRAFLRSTARHCLIGGGNASGKTSALLAAAAMQSGNSKHRAIIFRKDYPSLKHIISSSYPLFLPMRATYNKSEHCWYWPSGATLEFSHLEDEAAVFQHAGKQYSFIGFDELTQLPGDVVDSRGKPINSAFSFMQTRLRADADSGLSLECRATASPGGPGMGWVKAFYQIPESGESSEFVHPVTGFRHQYVRALARDNPAIDAVAYARQMADLTSAQWKALTEGNWSSYEGQVFETFSLRDHVCEPFPVPASFEIFRCADDGFAAPCACYWLAEDPVYQRVYVVAELWQRQMTPEVMAAAILQIDRSIPIDLLDGTIVENDMPISGVIDSASFAKTGMEGTSRADMLNKLGCKFSPCEKGSGSRISGIMRIHQALAMKWDGKPGLIIFNTCKQLLRTLPAMTYSRTHPEDIDDGCERHGCDAIAYGLQRRKIKSGMTKIRFAHG